VAWFNVNGRLSVVDVVRLLLLKMLVATICGPGMLCSVPLTRMPYHGSVYDASALYCDRNGVSWWQKPAADHEPAAAMGAVTPAGDAMFNSSGRSSMIWQLSKSVFPVLTPPWTNSPFRRRASTV